MYQCKGEKVCVKVILVSVIVIMLKFSYIFICFLSLMYQCKGGKVCVIETLVSVIVIMLKFS